MKEFNTIFDWISDHDYGLLTSHEFIQIEQKRHELMKEFGVYPTLYKRGDVWRFHVDKASNNWEDDPMAIRACERAIEAYMGNSIKI